MTRILIFCGFVSARQDWPSVDCEQSLIFLCTRNLRTRAAKPRAAGNEGVSPRRKNKSFLVWSQSLIVIITSWFAIALDEIKTRRILREKADCKQSRLSDANLTLFVAAK